MPTTAAKFKIKSIVFACNRGACVPDNSHKHTKGADIMVLIADGTDIDLQFTNSPFQSGNTNIHIPKGTAVAEFVDTSIASGTHFPYALTCTNPRCSTSNNPPEMIVD